MKSKQVQYVQVSYSGMYLEVICQGGRQKFGVESWERFQKQKEVWTGGKKI